MANVNYSPLIDLIQKSFRSEAALGVDFSVNLTITGEKEETWFLQIKAGKCVIQNANGASADAQVALSQDNLLHLLRGDMNPTLAVFTGKIHLSGNQSGLLKLTSLFDIDKEKLTEMLKEYR